MEYRRILLDGCPTDVVLDGDTLVARDGRRVEAAAATHLSPVSPT
ncbi:MAG: FAA hydrolase family protein, partial [Acidimicrobiales bacterium]